MGHSDSKELASRTLFATLGVALSRVSGVFRALIVNAVFGAGVQLDAYNLAMRFPTVLRDLFAEGALSAAFTKVLVRARSHGPATEQKLVSLVITAFSLLTTLISCVLFWFAYPIVKTVGVGEFSAQGGNNLAALCFQVLIFYLPLAMLSSVAMALLGIRGATFRATIASLFFNVGSVLGALLGAPLAIHLGFPAILGLALGTLMGGFLQFVYQAYPLFKEGIFTFASFRCSYKNFLASDFPKEAFAVHPLKEIFLLMLPRAVGQGALSLALFINTYFATAAGIGAITYITNAQNIILVPVGLFGVASGFASLPMLTEAVQAKDSVKFTSLLESSCRSVLWLSTLAVVCLALFSIPIARFLLGHGKVTNHDTIMNGLAIASYCMGILFNSLNKIVTQSYYALGDTRQILVNAFAYLFCNASLSFLLAPKYGVLGLGISNCLSAAFDLFLNFFFLPKVASKRHLQGFGSFRGSGFFPQIFLLVLASLVVTVFSLVYLRSFFSDWLLQGWLQMPFNTINALLISSFGCSLVLLLWGCCLFKWGPQELAHWVRTLVRRVRVR